MAKSSRQRQQAYLRELKQRFDRRGARKNVIVATHIARRDIPVMTPFTCADPVVLRNIFGLGATATVALRVKINDTMPFLEKPQHFLVATITHAR